jgi:hypothetical protein
MILLRPARRERAGITIFDLLVFMAACLPAAWVSSYFHGGWRTVVFVVCYLVFGIGLWSFTFLWALPFIRRHRQGNRDRET